MLLVQSPRKVGMDKSTVVLSGDHEPAVVPTVTAECVAPVLQQDVALAHRISGGTAPARKAFLTYLGFTPAVTAFADATRAHGPADASHGGLGWDKVSDATAVMQALMDAEIDRCKGAGHVAIIASDIDDTVIVTESDEIFAEETRAVRAMLSALKEKHGDSLEIHFITARYDKDEERGDTREDMHACAREDLAAVGDMPAYSRIRFHRSEQPHGITDVGREKALWRRAIADKYADTHEVIAMLGDQWSDFMALNAAADHALRRAFTDVAAFAIVPMRAYAKHREPAKYGLRLRPHYRQTA